MKTNEKLRRDLLEAAESAIEQMMRTMEELPEGELEQLEQQVISQVMELGRKCLEQTLAHQAWQKGSAARREGTCGHWQRLVGTRSRQLKTLLGTITIRRAYYQCMPTAEEVQEEKKKQCRHGEAPFDQQWGLGSQRSSPGVQKVVSYLAAQMTQEEVAAAVSRLLPLSLSPRQVGNICDPIGKAFVQQENRQMQERMREGTAKNTSENERDETRKEPIKRLYVEMDGVMARLRRGSVPMDEKEEERGRDVYREVKVGAVFVGEPGRERSALAPGVFIDTAGPMRYIARRASAEAFAPLLYALACDAGLRRAKEVVVLADGARWIWKLADEHFPGAIQIVDEYHAQEHVWEVARAAFPAEQSAGEAWASQVNELLAQGRIEQVITAISRLPSVPPPPGKSRSIPETETDYFRTNAERMRYPHFRAQGLQIGSGIAEASCKTVVSTRLKRSGMRWTPDGLAGILALRTSVRSVSFDQRWQEVRKLA